MNILWISFYGSWTLPLLKEINKNNQGKTAIIVPIIGGKNKIKEVKDGIVFYSLPFNRKELFQNMTLKTFQKFNEIIKEFNPDIIHVHGTEKNLGQIQSYIPNIPVVISIQGIIRACRPYYLNYLDKDKIRRFTTIKNLLGRGGIERTKKIFENGDKYETNIIKEGKYFFCRTLWDYAHITLENPDAHIFQGEEILRESFYENQGKWDINKIEKYRIFMPSGSDPLKGLHHAIETVMLLKKDFPKIKLIVPGLKYNHIHQNKIKDFLFGEEYMRYIKHLIKNHSIQENIILLNRLDANEMVEEMKKANVFLSPSSIDNSPNAIGEAMMIGTPIVTTPVGGIPSFMKDEISCLFASAGDPFIMAYQIKRIFEDENLACLLSNNATVKARMRHSIETITKQYIGTYLLIIKKHESTII